MTSEQQEPTRPAIHWMSVGQFIFSLFAVITLWCIAGLVALFGLFALFSTSFLASEATSLLIYAAGLGFIGLLLVPSAYFSFLRLRGQHGSWPEFIRKPWFKPGLLSLLFPVFLITGSIVSQTGNLSWLLLPPLHILAILVPIWWVFSMGSRDLPTGSPQRAWGVLGSGLVLSPLLAGILQMLILAGVVVMAMFYLTTRPDLSEEIINLITRLSILERYADPTEAPEMILEVMRPYVQGPVVVYGALIFVAILVPMIEEMVKPIGILFLAGSALSPAAGFVVGMLSGAGFALCESMLYSNSEDWSTVVASRAFSAVVHIMTTGLVGYALAVAWRKRNYLQLGFAYLLAVLIHGLWNGFALLNFSYSFIIEMPEIPPIITTLALISPLVIGFLALEMFVYLLWSNNRLRKFGNTLQ